MYCIFFSLSHGSFQTLCGRFASPIMDYTSYTTQTSQLSAVAYQLKVTIGRVISSTIAI